MSKGLLEEKLGHRFSSPELLDLALTHSSHSNEESRGRGPNVARNNETLEFLGDAVLGLAVVEHLYRKHPDLPEGDLSLMKHRIVSTETLADVASALDLGSHMKMGRGEEMTGGRTKQAVLADAMEAVIGAVFLDAGFVTARAFVERSFAAVFKAVTPRGSLDAKTRLQELLQSRKMEPPVYEIVNTEGPAHKREFHVSAKWQGGRAEGHGSSIKAAEMVAAEEALKRLEDGIEAAAPQPQT